ncbi:MAG: DUF2461 domain-containing protein [Fulvivirga sp.]|nr:DUF2461 domain-containing protein [Fulvivirga sp.]
MKKTLDFLKKVKKNNNREWFNENKAAYLQSEEELKSFVHQVAAKMSAHDVIDPDGTKIYRIYRDVRFSNDKTPYKKHRAAHFKRFGADRRGGYYLHIEPGNNFIAGGFWRPSSDDLLLMRKHIEQDAEPLRDILNQKGLKNYFGEMVGDKVKTAPKGFSRDHPAIDLLQYKGYILTHEFTDDEVVDPHFAQEVSDGFRNMRPFLDYMTEIVTTDLNGVPLAEK